MNTEQPVSDPRTATARELTAMVGQWLRAPSGSAERRAAERWLGTFQAQLVARSFRFDTAVRSALADCYRQSCQDVPAVCVLSLLATEQQPSSLRLWCELLLEWPPTSPRAAGAAFAPLLARTAWDPQSVFPQLLDGLDQLDLAPLILDLANFATRRGLVAVHPASSRQGLLTRLLGELSERLSLLQQTAAPAEAPPGVGRQIAESLELAVSCCDALALIGEPTCTPSLYKALVVPHRRLQSEAAYALARLHQPAGMERLRELAGEAVVRARVLAYASELGQLDEIAPEHRSREARAEADLVQLLADPSQFGIPPLSCQLLDQQTLAWPGFDQPLDCCLFEYTYPVAELPLIGRALVGPVTRAPRLDLSPLSLADTYAYFAGWQAEHPEITELPCEAFQDQHLAWAQRLLARVPGHWTIQRTVLLGLFLGEPFLICEAIDSQTPESSQHGTLIVGPQTLTWFPTSNPVPQLPPLSAREYYCVVKGRQLLRSFNANFPI